MKTPPIHLFLECCRLASKSTLLIIATVMTWMAPRSDGRDVRVATFDIEEGLGATNSAEYAAVQAVLDRMSADIVCIQSLRTNDLAAWSNLTTDLGYPFSAVGEDGPFSGGLRNAFCSRFPILDTFSLTSPTGAVEFSRLPLRASFDVPNTDRPLVIWNMQHKQGYLQIDLFRRAIEAQRIAQDIRAYLSTHPDHGEYLLVGNMGDDIRSSQLRDQFEWRQPSGAPADYVLGADIVFPVPYSIFPTDRYADAGQGLQLLFACWEGTNSPVTRPSSHDWLDYVFLSPSIAHHALGSPTGEVYYSAMDAGGGLPKQGSLLPAETSAQASSHLPVFVDFHMDNHSQVQPPTGLSANGEQDGPFSPDRKAYAITETNDAPSSWTIETDVVWISFDSTNFQTVASFPYPVWIWLNENAASLPPGLHSGAVTFRNLTSGAAEIRTVSLAIRDPLDVSPTNGFSTSGTVGGPFSPASITYVLTNKNSAPLSFTVTAASDWLDLAPASGILAGHSSTEVLVGIRSNANALPFGTYADTVVFSNQTSGQVHLRSVQLAANGGLCDAVDRCDTDWTTGGNANWFYQTNDTADSVDAARCGALTTNQQTWMETTVTGPMHLHFQWKISSRETHPLRFLDNGTVKRKIGGEIPWTNEAYQVGVGIHTLRWEYVTSEYVPQGSNAAWLDRVAWDALLIQPTNTWGAGGISGGPFTNATRQYVLTNAGASTLRWSATSASNWISVLPDSGELPPHGTLTLDLSLNTNAYDLFPGTYANDITFFNLTTEFSASRPVSLVVRSPLSLTPILAMLSFTGCTGGGLYSPAVQTLLISNQSARACTWLSTPTNWITMEPSGGTLAPRSNCTISVSINTNAFSLPPGQIFTDLYTVNRPAHSLPYCTASITLQESFALVSPSSWVPSGPSGGPFSPPSQTYVLTNRNSVAQNWTVSSPASWLSFDPSSGELAGTSSTTIAATVNSNAAALPIGNYTNIIFFTDLHNGVTFTQTVMLAVGSPFCESIEACDLAWTFGGNTPWFAQTNVTQDGIDAAQSGSITNHQHSWMQTTVTGPRLLTYQWRTSSTTNLNYLRFQIDGTNRAELSGNTAWATHSTEITPGVHTLRWVFTNSFSSTGTNAAWVDRVALDGLVVTPTNIWGSGGPSGGPFTNSSRTYLLTNSSATPLQWSALVNSPWISATPASGDLMAGSSTNVVLSLNTNARALFSGTYTNPIAFSNRTTGRLLSRVATCAVQNSLFVNPGILVTTGFVGGAYMPASHSLTLSNSAITAIVWSVRSSQAWLTLTPTNGTLGPNSTASLDVAVNTNAHLLTGNTHSASLIFTNATMRRFSSTPFSLNLQEALLFSGTPISFSGPIGGPFEPPTPTFVLTNRSDSSQSWGTSNSAPWLVLDPSSGTLPPHSTLSVLATPLRSTPMGSYFTRIAFSNLLNGYATTQDISLAVGCTFCEAVDACTLAWSLGGSAPWLFQTNTTRDGLDAACSGPIANSQESWFQTSVTGPGTLTFWWSVSAQTNNHYLEFYINNSLTNRITDTVDWQQKTYTLTSGVYTLRWRYKKYNSGTPFGSDCGWVDLVNWSPLCTTRGVPIGWYEQFGMNPSTNGTWDDLDTLPAAGGTPNWIQYVAGLNPTNSTDTFRILSVRQENGQPLQIDWWGGTNGPATPYIIQSTFDVIHGPWESLGLHPRDSGVNTWTHADPDPAIRYYRILATPSP